MDETESESEVDFEIVGEDQAEGDDDPNYVAMPKRKWTSSNRARRLPRKLSLAHRPAAQREGAENRFVVNLSGSTKVVNRAAF